MLKRLSGYLTVMGIPGLLAITFLDSAAIPITGGPDAIILVLAWQRPALTYLIILAATIGSTLGCFVLYGIGQKGGEKALSRFNPERTARVEAKMRKHGLWAIVASVLAPPPFPTKVVILAAGVLRINRLRFTAGVFAGRLIRYSIMGCLGARFGNRAAQILKRQYPTISLILLACILIAILIRILKRRK